MVNMPGLPEVDKVVEADAPENVVDADAEISEDAVEVADTGTSGPAMIDAVSYATGVPEVEAATGMTYIVVVLVGALLRPTTKGVSEVLVDEAVELELEPESEDVVVMTPFPARGISDSTAVVLELLLARAELLEVMRDAVELMSDDVELVLMLTVADRVVLSPEDLEMIRGLDRPPDVIVDRPEVVPFVFVVVVTISCAVPMAV